jgi:hypothetical protein
VRAFRRLKRADNERLFIRKAKAIRDTRPLAMKGNSPLFLSMIRHSDVATYLLAIKSLYTGIGQGRVMIINDGSLTAGDLTLLNHHVPGIEVLDSTTIATGACPRGGTWERLFKILELSSENYVIQVDADVLVSGPIPEVVECWRENRSFLLGTGSGRVVSTAAATAQWCKAGSKPMIGQRRRSPSKATQRLIGCPSRQKSSTSTPPWVLPGLPRGCSRPPHWKSCRGR